MLLIDDAHLLDPSTAEALRFALRRLLGEPLGAVLAVRADEPSLLDDTDLPTLHVGGLSRDAAGELLGAVAPETADRIYRATAGNPLALTELARDTSRLATLSIDAPITVPATISRAFARRAEALELVSDDDSWCSPPSTKRPMSRRSSGQPAFSTSTSAV